MEVVLETLEGVVFEIRNIASTMSYKGILVGNKLDKDTGSPNVGMDMEGSDEDSRKGQED